MTLQGSDHVIEAVSEALVQGQGYYTEEQLELACREIDSALTKGLLAAFVLEGRMKLSVVDGVLDYDEIPDEDPREGGIEVIG